MFYGAALLVCLIFCIANGLWFSWILLLAAAALPWLSLLLSLRSMVTARMELRAPRRVQAEEPCSVTAALQSKGIFLPSYARLQVYASLTGETRTLRPGEELPTRHCGALTVTPLRPFCCDPLCLWRRHFRKMPPLTVYVFPRRQKQDPPAGLEQHLSAAWRPRPGGGFSEQHELREYRPGDSLNQIHWKLSAKTGGLMIREPMEPLHTRMLLTLDLQGSPDELDHKLGRLLWLGEYLLEQTLTFSVLALTGDGLLEQSVASAEDLQTCMEALLSAAPAAGGSVLDHPVQAAWRYHIGGAVHGA